MTKNNRLLQYMTLLEQKCTYFCDKETFLLRLWLGAIALVSCCLFLIRNLNETTSNAVELGSIVISVSLTLILGFALYFSRRKYKKLTAKQYLRECDAAQLAELELWATEYSDVACLLKEIVYNDQVVTYCMYQRIAKWVKRNENNADLLRKKQYEQIRVTLKQLERD